MASVITIQLSRKDLSPYLERLQTAPAGAKQVAKSVPNTAVPKLNEKLASNDVAVTFVNHEHLLQSPGPEYPDGPGSVSDARCPSVCWSCSCTTNLASPPMSSEYGLILSLTCITTTWIWDKIIEAQPALRTHRARFDRKQNTASLHRIWYTCTNSTGGTTYKSFALKSTLRPTPHFAGRSLWDRQSSLWGSHTLHDHCNRLIYFGGDSGYSCHFSEIRQRLVSPDLAFLGIGAHASVVHNAHAHEP